jgi:hypothetical protein
MQRARPIRNEEGEEPGGWDHTALCIMLLDSLLQWGQNFHSICPKTLSRVDTMIFTTL